MARRHLAWLIAIAGCSVGGEAGHPSASAVTSPPATAPTAASSSSAGARAPAPADWREAARHLDWKRAYELIAALPDEERKKPEMRLAFGRVALGAGDHAAAVKALEGLDAVLPVAAEEAKRWYAEAAAVVGPHEAAASYFARSPKVTDLLTAGRALERGDKNAAARALYDKAIQRAERTRRRSDEARGHLYRGRLAEKMGDKAVAAADYGWLVRERATEPEAREALEGLDRVGGVIGLDLRLVALAGSTTRQNLEKTLETLDALEKKHPGQKVSLDFTRAKALYAARDYEKAKAAFEALRKTSSPWSAEALYYGAQAKARSGDAESALAQYLELAQRFPKSRYAERGAYRHAELLALRGKHAEAAAAFGRYLARFGKSAHATEARFAQAIALLSSGSAKKARALFAGLRGDVKSWRDGAHYQHLEAVAADGSGDRAAATKLWLELIREQPLTYPALAAHARLKAIGHEPLPALMAPPPEAAAVPLAISMPTAPALLVSLGLDLAAERRLEDLEDDAAKEFPGRESEALCALYGQLSGARRRAQIANRAVSLESLLKAPSAREDRWAWECIYPQPYAELVREQERAREVPAGLVHAVMRQESFFRTTATSPVGARGLMQLMPNTAQLVGGEIGLELEEREIVRPDLNVTLGAFYLGKLLDNFGGHVALAAAGYNAGPTAVASWLGGGEKEIDLFIARIPYEETRAYVQRVLSNFARYQYLSGGVAAVTPLELAVPTSYDIGENAY